MPFPTEASLEDRGFTNVSSSSNFQKGQKMGAAFSMGANIGASVGEGVGALISGAIQKDLFDFNAKVSKLQARDAVLRGRRDEATFRRSVGQAIGSQRALLAAQGLDPNEGTALAIQVDTQKIGELDALTIRNNAALEAWGFRTQAVAQKFQGEVAEAQAITQAVGAFLS